MSALPARGSGSGGGSALARLPAATSARLRTQHIIGSLAQAAEELVHNALDAGATSVSVTLDAAEGGAACADDGHGVPTAQLRLLGQRHHTSKLTSLAQLHAGVPTLGFRGEALASIADTAVLEVLTRADGEFDTGHLVVKGGAALSCGLSATPRARGTTVVLRAFMHNQPVRRATLLADPAGEVERCRERLLRIALARPDVRLSLDVGAVTSPLAPEAPPLRRVLDCAAGRTLPGTFHAAYGGVLGGGGALAAVAARAGALALSGVAAVPPHGGARTAEAQHLFLCGRALRRGAAHRIADSLFAAAVDAMGGDGDAAAARPSRMAGRARGPGRHAAFALHLSVPPGFADVTSEADKTVAEFRDWPAVCALLADALLGAWRDAGAPPEALRAATRAAAAAGAAAPPSPPLPAAPPPPSQPQQQQQRAPPPPLPQWVTAGKRAHADADADEPCATGCLCARTGGPFTLDAWQRRKVGGSGSAAAAPDETTVAAAFAAWTNPAWPSRGAALSSEVATAAALALAPATLHAAALTASLPACVGQASGTSFLLACSADGVLLAVDPHAAHERVRLEALTAEALGPGGSTAAPRGVPSAPPAPPLPPLPLTPLEAAAMRAHGASLAAWGWSLAEEPHEAGAAGAASLSVRILAAPVVAGVPLRAADLAEHLRALAAAGAAAGMPPAAQRALASRACRGAVTLGTALAPHDADALLSALARTAQPLSCAHGRPTAAPLADAAAMAARMDALEAERLRPLHRPTAARARALLAAASPLDALFALEH